jgi:hypothetical protein
VISDSYLSTLASGKAFSISPVGQPQDPADLGADFVSIHRVFGPSILVCRARSLRDGAKDPVSVQDTIHKRQESP